MSQDNDKEIETRYRIALNRQGRDIEILTSKLSVATSINIAFYTLALFDLIVNHRTVFIYIIGLFTL